MTMQEKEEFVIGLTTAIQQELLNRLGKVPDEWDGFELRQWIADRTAREVCKMNRKRMITYRNAVTFYDL